MGATAASAAEPTGVTVTPSSQWVAAGGSATLNVTLTGTAPLTASNGVYYRVTNGPDATTGNGGQLCFTGATSGTCSVTNANGAGVDTIQVFYDKAGVGANFQNGDPVAVATATFGGDAVRTSVAPASAKRATGSSAAYTITGTDANGNPASGSVSVTLSQTFATARADGNPLMFTDPSATAFPAPATLSPPSMPGSSGTAPITYTDTETFNFDKGSVTIGAASLAAGSVTISAGQNSTSFSAGTATLTVSAGNTDAGPSVANDDNASALTVAGASSFTNQSASVVVTVTNAAGDPLGGVEVQGKVTAGPNAGVTATAASTTDQLGKATLTYGAGNTAGTDTVQAWVNQDTHASNTPGPDAGEPQGTAQVKLQAKPAGLHLNASGPTSPIPLSQKSTTFTFTAADGSDNPVAGLTVDFAVDNSSTPTDGYTLSATSAVTDANGQAKVTATAKNAPQNGDSVTVDASVHGAVPAADSSASVTYAASAATTATVTPANQTVAVGATVTDKVTVLDNFGSPVSGNVVSWAVTGRNGPANNSNSTGSCTTGSNGSCTFSYTDYGAPIAEGDYSNTDTVTATPTGLSAVNASVLVVNAADLVTKSLTVSANQNTAPTSPDGSASDPSPVITVTAHPKDANGHDIYNKTVSFTSAGVGVFTDSFGAPVGTSTSAATDSNGNAIVFVRSSDPGTQTITASSDGVTAKTAVTYTSQYAAITPQRVVDTRIGQGNVNNGTLAPNSAYYFNLTSTNLPLDEQAYAFNVTAIHPSGAGNLRIGPSCVQPPWSDASSNVPETSLINYQAGKDIANFVVVPNQGCNQFVIYTAGSSVNVAIDAVGYWNNGYDSISPSRAVDTRSGLGSPAKGAIAAGTSRSFQIADANSGNTAVALNVTAIGPNGNGNLRVYPDGSSVPMTSNINYIKGVDKAAFVIVQLPANGKIDVYSAGSAANVAIDVYGFLPVDSIVKTQAPQRILDTRSAPGLTLEKNTPFTFQVAGKAGVPADAQAVLVSLTAIHTSGSTGVGNLRIYPAGVPTPTVSTVNYVSATSDVANFAIVPLGTDGKVTLYSGGSRIDAAVDVLGYVPATGGTTPAP